MASHDDRMVTLVLPAETARNLAAHLDPSDARTLKDVRAREVGEALLVALHDGAAWLGSFAVDEQ